MGPGCGQGVSPEPEATAALLLLAARILADLPGLPRSPGEALSHPSVPIPLVPVLPHLVRVPACAAASKSHRTPLPGCTKAPSSQRASHHCACHTPGCHKKFVRGHQLVATKCTRDRSASQALSAPGASPVEARAPPPCFSSNCSEPRAFNTSPRSLAREPHAQPSLKPRPCRPSGPGAALQVLSPPEQQQLACHPGSVAETPGDSNMPLTPQECKEEA